LGRQVTAWLPLSPAWQARLSLERDRSAGVGNRSPRQLLPFPASTDWVSIFLFHETPIPASTCLSMLQGGSLRSSLTLMHNCHSTSCMDPEQACNPWEADMRWALLTSHPLGEGEDSDSLPCTGTGGMATTVWPGWNLGPQGHPGADGHHTCPTWLSLPPTCTQQSG
jgi:hypothetical protein